MMRPLILPAVLLAIAAAAGAAQALPPLKDDPRVQREFLAVAIGDEIRKKCPSIRARMMRVLSRANDLESYALGLGYTKADISAMREDPGAKAWLTAQRDHYLSKNGVTPGDTDSYCRLGLQEIAKNSLTGWLLRAN